MINNITPDEKQQVKSLFTDWEEIEDRKKELKHETDGVVDATAKILDVKKGTVSKFFKAMKKRMEDGTDDTDEIGALIELIRD